MKLRRLIDCRYFTYQIFFELRRQINKQICDAKLITTSSKFGWELALNKVLRNAKMKVSRFCAKKFINQLIQISKIESYYARGANNS